MGKLRCLICKQPAYCKPVKCEGVTVTQFYCSDCKYVWLGINDAERIAPLVRGRWLIKDEPPVERNWWD